MNKDYLLALIKATIQATQIYSADSITSQLKDHHHFYLCNRLFLLNLAAIYSTGFECPDPERIIPELRFMLTEVYSTYLSFNQSFPTTALPANYIDLYKNTISFVNKQSSGHEKFDHFTFIK